jgi:formylglycine-generating enzyme required for sulfatase activity
MKRPGERLFVSLALSAIALLLIFTLSILGQGSFPGLQPDVAAFLQGDKLTLSEANATEKELERSPEDLVSHCKLISYYFYHDKSGINWEKHLFWLIDSHPESGIFDSPFPISYIVRTNGGRPASPELLSKYKEHWEQAAAAHPKDAIVLLHTAMALSTQDPSQGLAFARKAVEADPKCIRCRNTVGGLIGFTILRFPPSITGNWTCIPMTPEVEQTVSELRKEIESSTDSEIILDAGMAMRGYSQAYGSHCAGNSDEVAAFGNELIRKAVGLDASLIDRRKIQNIVNSLSPSVAEQAKTKVNSQDGLTYVWISSGTFRMGCSLDDSECKPYEGPTRTVTLTRGFWIGQTPVTQAAYKKVTGANPSKFRGDQLPVESVSWDDAKSYCEGTGMKLPTEAEWEYAARGGSSAARYALLGQIAWYGANSGGTTHEVGQKQANGYGLFDMLGNVWEWVADRHGPYDSASAVDPTGPPAGQFRVLRGGSWGAVASLIRLSYRVGNMPGVHLSVYGFRCAGN